jgi:hypothetical protein
MYSRTIVPVLVLAALLLSLACAGAHTQGGQFTQHYGDSLFEITQNQIFSVELLLSGPLGVGENSMQMVVHNRQDQDVEGAEVKVRAFPEGQEPSARTHEASDLGHGLYSVHHVEVASPGRLIVAVDVSKGGESGTAYFEFPEVAGEASHTAMQPAAPHVQGGHGHGQDGHGHGAVSAGEPKETGTSVKSARDLFQVSYEPRTGKIPVGRVHAWNLKVLDGSGRPVQGATIVAEGEMPEHRHGLPTKPEVTESGSGTYVVQGMKFNMPGWWILRFHVFTEEQRDTAEFHLVLQ